MVYRSGFITFANNNPCEYRIKKEADLPVLQEVKATYIHEIY